MSQAFSFARLQAEIGQAAQKGARDAASELAESFRGAGERASVNSAPDGTVQIALEGAAAVAREFGTPTAPAQPVIGDALRAHRQEILDSIARKIAAAAKGGHS